MGSLQIKCQLRSYGNDGLLNNEVKEAHFGSLCSHLVNKKIKSTFYLALFFLSFQHKYEFVSESGAKCLFTVISISLLSQL